MRFHTAQFAICLAMLAAAGIARAVDGIELSVKPVECRPGDLIELKAVMTRSDFAGMELEMPKNDALHPVTRTTSPVRYRDGIYTQEISWIMQPTRAGTIELGGIKARVKQGGRVTEIALPARSLSVPGYGEAADTMEPMTLPEAAAGTKPLNPILLLGLAAAAVLLLVFFLRTKPKAAASVSPVAPDLRDVRDALDRGESPIALMERMLDEGAMRLPDRLREAMERAVYGGKLDKDELMRLIEKEDAR